MQAIEIAQNLLLDVWLKESRIVYGYFFIAFVVSGMNAIRIYYWRYWDEIEEATKKPIKKSEKGWEALTNFTFQFLGFVFLYISLVILVKLDDTTKDTPNLVVHASLFLVLFFYSIFCISGRGIEVLHPVIDTLRKAKIASIEFSWRGIRLYFEREGETNHEKKIQDK